MVKSAYHTGLNKGPTFQRSDLISYIIGILFLTLFYTPVHPVYAAISDCSASVNKTSVNAGTSNDFVLAVTNYDPVFHTIRWVKVSRPSPNFTITSATAGWSSSVTTGDATFTGGTIGYGQTTNFTVTATAGSSGASSANWYVQVSDSGSGSNPTDCGGTLGTEIIGPTGAVISNVTSESITGGTAVITWTTDQSANSVVQYGTSVSYGSTAGSESESVTSHSVSLSGLSQITTYHYKVQSTTGGVTTESDDYTFTTTTSPSSTPGPSSTPSTTTTTTTTTILITPTPAPDQTKPVVTLTTVVSKPYKTAPLLSGNAMDNKGVSLVEYAVDGSTTWRSVKQVTSPGALSTNFSFTPALTDGIHTISVRAKDAAGNISLTATIVVTIDQKGPTVSFITDFSKPFLKSPLITGTAEDAGGIESIEYRVHEGAGWQKTEPAAETPAKAGFSIVLPPLDDGNYNIQIRSTDALGNISETVTRTLIIDRLPPVVGGMAVSVGSQILSPDQQGELVTEEGLPARLILSAVGGPTVVQGQVKDADTGTDVSTFLFTKHSVGTIWYAEPAIDKPGRYQLSVHAEDGAGNITDTTLGVINVLGAGSVRSYSGNAAIYGVNVTVYAFDSLLSTYVPWDGASYGIPNPQKTDEEGKFRLILPSGSYYLTVEKSGFRRIQSNIFAVKQTMPVIAKFSLKARPAFSFGPIRVSLPQFGADLVRIQPENLPSSGAQTPIKYADIPQMKLTDGVMTLEPETFHGKPSIVSLINTWVPQATEQIDVLDQMVKTNKDTNVIVVVPQESQSSVDLFKNRGGYQVPMIADPDGAFASVLNYHYIPTHYILDRNAGITAVLYGVKSNRQLIEGVNGVQ